MIRHILRDGTQLNDVEGHIIKQTEIKTIYQLIEAINERKSNEKEN